MDFDKIYYIVDCTYTYVHRLDFRLFKDKNKAIKEAVEYGKKEWVLNSDKWEILIDGLQIKFLEYSSANPKTEREVVLYKTLCIQSYDII